MSWECPVCKRKFKHTKQEHSCIVTDITEHFINKDEVVYKIYDKLIGFVNKFGEVNINPTKHTIIISSNSTFLAVKPKKSALDIEFLLERAVEGYPINKIVRVSKKRFAHFVRLEIISEVNKKLISLLKESYSTVNKN